MNTNKNKNLSTTSENIAYEFNIEIHKKYSIKQKRVSWGYDQYMIVDDQGVNRWICLTTRGRDNFSVD
mgnify:FL=1